MSAARPRVAESPPAPAHLPAAPPGTDRPSGPVEALARAAPPGPAAAEIAKPLTPPNFSASYLRNPPPRYPIAARRNGEEGTVTLRVRVTANGRAESVSIEQSSGSASLDRAALEAVRGWRFVPARQGADPVDAWVLVPVVFRLDGVS